MRYIILLIFNTPIILMALISVVTQYKLRSIQKGRFVRQSIFWLTLLVALFTALPLYNVLSGRAPLDSGGLSVLDIVQATAVFMLFYVINRQRQSIERTERRLRELHQKLSIILSERVK